MVPPGHAPGHMQVEVLIVTIVAGDNLFQQTAPFLVGMRVLQTNTIKAVLQAEQMFSQAKRLVGINRDDFIHAVTKNETSIQHGNACFLDRHEITVEINHDEPCS